MKPIFIILVLGLCSTVSMAQKKPLRKQRIIFSHGVGYDFPLKTITANPFTDPLTDLNDKGISIQAFAISWFIKKNIGLEFLMQGIATNNRKDRNQLFNQRMENQWSNQYYYNSYNFYGGGMSRFMGAWGLSYKIEKRRFTYTPKFYIGSVSIDQSPTYNLYLKGRNSNTVLTLDYSADKSAAGKFMMSPAFSVVYRFNSIVGVGLNTSFLWHPSNMVYTETLTNLVTNEVSTQQYKYDKTMKRFNIGLNVSVGFGRRNELVGQ